MIVTPGLVSQLPLIGAARLNMTMGAAFSQAAQAFEGQKYL
jgi:hypothetical protein